MTQAHTPTVAIDDLSVLLPDWRTHLRARNIAPTTITSYLKVGDDLLTWLCEPGRPTTASGIAREHLEAFLAALSERVSPATVAKHYRSLQQLFQWLVEDGEIPRSPMERMRPPAVPEQPVDILTDDELRALLDAARGNTFENRRDTAMLIDTGMRAEHNNAVALREYLTKRLQKVAPRQRAHWDSRPPGRVCRSVSVARPSWCPDSTGC